MLFSLASLPWTLMPFAFWASPFLASGLVAQVGLWCAERKARLNSGEDNHLGPMAPIRVYKALRGAAIGVSMGITVGTSAAGLSLLSPAILPVVAPALVCGLGFFGAWQAGSASVLAQKPSA
jgi:hypothetical protein